MKSVLPTYLLIMSCSAASHIMDAVKAKIKALSLNPTKNYFSKSRPWKTEVELRLKMNSDSWYNRANKRRKFHFYVDEDKVIIPDLELLDDKEDKKVRY